MHGVTTEERCSCGEYSLAGGGTICASEARAIEEEAVRSHYEVAYDEVMPFLVEMYRGVVEEDRSANTLMAVVRAAQLALMNPDITVDWVKEQYEDVEFGNRAQKALDPRVV
jgi:hypothetical protein